MKTKLTEAQVRTLIAEALIQELKSRPEKLTEAELQELLGALKGGLGTITGGIKKGLGAAATAVAGKVEQGYKAASTAATSAKDAVVAGAKAGEDIATLEKASGVVSKVAASAEQVLRDLQGRKLSNANVNLPSGNVTTVEKGIASIQGDLQAISAALKQNAAQIKANKGKPATDPNATATTQEARRVYEILERNGLTKKRD
jgi:hypothetical protein